jgi:hypothetical protein
MDEKCCTKCKRTKPSSEFHKLTNSRDGLQAYCKECNIAAARGYFDARKIAKRIARAKKQT